jgi:hypothetical protein
MQSLRDVDERAKTDEARFEKAFPRRTPRPLLTVTSNPLSVLRVPVVNNQWLEIIGAIREIRC